MEMNLKELFFQRKQTETLDPSLSIEDLDFAKHYKSHRERVNGLSIGVEGKENQSIPWIGDESTGYPLGETTIFEATKNPGIEENYW